MDAKHQALMLTKTFGEAEESRLLEPKIDWIPGYFKVLGHPELVFMFAEIRGLNPASLVSSLQGLSRKDPEDVSGDSFEATRQELRAPDDVKRQNRNFATVPVREVAFL